MTRQLAETYEAVRRAGLAFARALARHPPSFKPLPGRPFIRGLGEFDECNGREGVTAEVRQGACYLVTAKFPCVPRCFMGGLPAGSPGGGPRNFMQ